MFKIVDSVSKRLKSLLSLLYRYISQINCKNSPKVKLCEQCIHRCVDVVSLVLNCTAVRALNRCANFGIDKKKNSPENCIFFLPKCFHLTLIFRLQRRSMPHHSFTSKLCINTITFSQLWTRYFNRSQNQV